MAVREETRRGKRFLIIDIRYRNPDGSPARYRRDSDAATKTAAREEERRIRDRIARTGSPFEEKAEPPADEAPSEPAPSVPTFGQVVEEYRGSFMLTDLKVTTRRGYASVLETVLLPRLADLPITAVDGHAASRLDLDLTQNGGERKGKLARSTRNNAQIVLRSVLRFALGKGYLTDKPKAMPRLKRIEQSILEIPSDAEVERILRLAKEHHRRSFALMAYAGLRPNEVRALLRRDLLLQREGGDLVGGFLSIREGRSFGQTDTPKTGRREVPIAPPLARLLGPLERGPKDGHLALSARGKPWGQFGLDQAFGRVCKRAGLPDWSIYALRHYAITMWLRRGIPVHVVQKMAGHKHLSTTQRYVHHLKADLEDAARRLAGVGNSWATGSGAVAPSPDRAA